MNVFLSPYKKYAVFSGRATPGEYWGFILSSIVFGIVVLFPLSILLGDTKDIILTLYTLVLLLPLLGVTIRRLHDTNRSAWWIFINLVPLFGGLALTVFMIIDGTSGENKYGPNPKQAQVK